MGTLILNGNRGKMIMNGVVYGNNIEAGGPNLADIFNHGDVVGLWPGFKHYSTGGSGWGYSDTYISSSRPNNGIFVLGGYFLKSNYTKICIDVEITEGTNGNYNISGLYLQYCKNGFPSGSYMFGNRLIKLTDYNSRTNYDGSSPWYTLQRQICEASLENITDEPFYLGFYKCDCSPKIYSIWLEE